MQIVYLSTISVAGLGRSLHASTDSETDSCLGASYIVLNPEYRKPTHRGARTAVFIALGLCGVIPVTHGLFAHGYRKFMYEMGFGWLVTSAVLYINGALL